MSNHSIEEDPCASSAKFLRSRVRSFASDPLHSAAYFSNISSYLWRPFDKSVNRYTRNPTPASIPLAENVFFSSYTISPTRIEPPIQYARASDFLDDTTSVAHEKSELVFLAGFPSPEWLNAVVSRYSLDHRFLHSHLDFLPSGQRDWYTAPDIPSRTRHSVRLMIPSIVFVGPEGRNISASDLHDARNASNSQLRRKWKSFFSSSLTLAGQSIVRHVNIHSGDTLVLEQAMTITVSRRGDDSKIIVWSDAGTDSDFVPIPDTRSFRNVAENIDFCPVFFEKDLQEGHQPTIQPNFSRHQQPLAILPSRYGETINWTTSQPDLLMILQELFQFHSSASVQYLNMLHRFVSDIHARTPLTGESPLNMENILHFDYARSILVRWSAHFGDLIENLSYGLLAFTTVTGPMTTQRQDLVTSLERDLQFLQRKAKTIIELCDSGKTTILSSFSIAESRRAAEESRLVTQLTKATNRITFIFLPISFVTSVFGMNFRQFGQGPLSIMVWVAVTIPLLTFCVILVEWGTKIASFFRRAWAQVLDKMCGY